VEKASRFAAAQRENMLLRQSLEDKFSSDNIIGRGKAMQRVLEMIAKAAPTRSTVLITGESGTGKELFAKAIHYASPRKDAAFISVNCMALASGVLESELFGHEKGSFTGAVARKRGRFEMAHQGTIFLDEIGELSPELQVKLLRVLQERKFERVGGSEPVEVDIRILAATNRNLAEAVAAGTFREDLYYRLNVVHIETPPLRERREDIPILAAHFLTRYSGENNKVFRGFSPEAMDYLTAYEWPGNVRQLQNVVERCVVLAASDVVQVEDLPTEIRDEESQYKSAVDLLPTSINLNDTLEKIEVALIRRALARSNFVQVKAAEMLEISKSLLQYKLKKYKLTGH
jgi:two-component system NtrC family response regulator